MCYSLKIIKDIENEVSSSNHFCKNNNEKDWDRCMCVVMMIYGNLLWVYRININVTTHQTF